MKLIFTFLIRKQRFEMNFYNCFHLNVMLCRNCIKIKKREERKQIQLRKIKIALQRLQLYALILHNIQLTSCFCGYLTDFIHNLIVITKIKKKKT